jgi:HEAT repeat protein
VIRKADPTEQALESLTELRAQSNATVVAELTKALKDRSNLVVAKAAKIAQELRVTAVIPELQAAFTRLMANPAKLDKRCAATYEIATALYALDYTEPEVYLLGIAHVQKEASFGPPIDEAAKLRAQCALGFARTNHPDALAKVADLLADSEPAARVGAIRALGTNGGETGEMLLRYKARLGDRDPQVVSECLTALLEANFVRSLPLLREMVDSEDEEIASAAVFALGSQRRAEAFAVLREKWEHTALGELRSTLLTAMAMARLDEAADYLTGLLDDVSPATGVEIVRALAAYHKDERVKARLKSAVEQNGNAALTAAFREDW